LVDGVTPAMRGSGVTAMRTARPKALNTVSAWWCVHAAQVVDVQRHAGMVHEALEKLAEQVDVEAADLRRA
jgi:hypothetical protein